MAQKTKIVCDCCGKDLSNEPKQRRMVLSDTNVGRGDRLDNKLLYGPYMDHKHFCDIVCLQNWAFQMIGDQSTVALARVGT